MLYDIPSPVSPCMWVWFGGTDSIGHWLNAPCIPRPRRYREGQKRANVVAEFSILWFHMYFLKLMLTHVTVLSCPFYWRLDRSITTLQQIFAPRTNITMRFLWFGNRCSNIQHAALFKAETGDICKCADVGCILPRGFLYTVQEIDAKLWEI